MTTRRTLMQLALGLGVAGTVKAHEERAATLKGFPTNRVLRGFLNVPEGQIHYRYRTPLGNRTPLLMLHGFPSSAWVLQPFVAALGEKRPTYAFDLMGMGDSTGLEMENPGIEDLATAVLHGLDALGIQTCDLYGTLTGARVATEITLMAPGRVRRLILEEPGIQPPEEIAEFLDKYMPSLEIDQEGSQYMRIFNRAYQSISS